MPGYGKRLIQHWNDWQLSALVLLSLFLQLLLLSTAGVRRRARPSWWRKKYFWALYIGSRFISTYALGILSRASTGDADADIQAFWACLLLFHLGGPDEFTALSLEDNKLWDRRCFELIIQVSTTVYVFFHYFLDQDFRRLVIPFALIFLAGLVKYIEQVVALRQATMDVLIESVLGTPDAGPDYADTMDRIQGILRSGALPSLNIGIERVDLSNPDPPEANEQVEEVHSQDQQQQEEEQEQEQEQEQQQQQQQQQQQEAKSIIRSAHSLFSRFNVLFADGIFSFEDRRESQARFKDKDVRWAFKVVEIELSFAYDRLYTKASVSRTTRVLVRVASLALTLAGSLWALFVTLHANQYQLRHRCITYTLLAGAVLNDMVMLAAHFFSIWSLVRGDWLECCLDRLMNHRRWSGRMAQSNLITFCLQKLPSDSELLVAHRPLYYLPLAVLAVLLTPNVSTLLAQELEASDGFPRRYFEKRSLEEQISSGSFWKKYKKTKHVPVRYQLKKFIFSHLRMKEGLFNDWERDNGAASNDHNPFTAYRGDKILELNKIEGLKWSIQDKDFDESLLIWHIATDLRFREEDNAGAAAAAEHMEMARELSNYLYYIMVVHPLMLSSSTTMATKRSRDTCAEARRHFLKEHIRATTADTKGGARAVSEANAHETLIKVDTPLHAPVVKGDKSKSVLWDGCFLARELAVIMTNPRRRWEVVCGVWVEMLCYAAVQCGGYQHAERLAEGGELLTFVCLLMTHLGMGKHYRTQVGDAYAHLSAYTA